MATPLITATQCFVPKSKEEEEQVAKTYQRYEELIIATLPRHKGWVSDHIYMYQGYWFEPDIGLKGAMYLQEHFKHRPTDVFIATSPKCGTTWLKALIFSIMNRATYTDMKAHPLLKYGAHECVPFLDVHLFRTNPVGDPEILPSPRLLGGHIAYALLPEMAKGPNGCRIVHVWRDPKDALISLWHFVCKIRKKVQMPELSLTEAFEMFSQGATPFGPFWDQVLGYWKASQEYPDKVLILKYEDMKGDTVSHVKRLAEFLGKPFTLEEKEKGIVHEILKLCSFESLSTAEVPEKGNFHEKLDYPFFFRKGEVGDWKNYLTVDMTRRLDEITEEKFRGTGLAK